MFGIKTSPRTCVVDANKIVITTSLLGNIISQSTAVLLEVYRKRPLYLKCCFKLICSLTMTSLSTQDLIFVRKFYEKKHGFMGRVLTVDPIPCKNQPKAALRFLDRHVDDRRRPTHDI